MSKCLRHTDSNSNLTSEEIFARDVSGLADIHEKSELPANLLTITAEIRRERGFARRRLAEAVLREVDRRVAATLTESSITGDGLESVEVDPRLLTFKADYDADDNLKSRISWAEIQARLLANNADYLSLALDMNQGGVLFGIDQRGNPLIADKGDCPIMIGMNYRDTRDRVLYQYTSLDVYGTRVLNGENLPILTPYEMFGFVHVPEKSDEILQYETHVGKPFVGDGYSSWLESDKDPIWACRICFDSTSKGTYVRDNNPRDVYSCCGVRRLLRVLKI